MYHHRHLLQLPGTPAASSSYTLEDVLSRRKTTSVTLVLRLLREAPDAQDRPIEIIIMCSSERMENRNPKARFGPKQALGWPKGTF